jgi:hypothetical protein
MDQQVALQGQLKEIVEGLHSVQRHKKDNRLIILPTGDGMALAFFGGVKPHVDAARELHAVLRNNQQIRLRTGLNTGPVHRVTDINGQPNVSGSGINLAQRVMDCGDAGHILLSNAVAEILLGLGSWEDLLQDLGAVGVKHGDRMHLFNMRGEGFGNDSKPSKLAAVTEATSYAKSRTPGSVEEAYPSKDIVRAWFDDAINPLIATLKSEEDLLGEETWTWDPAANKFQRLDCVYQPSSFGANQEDFLERYPNIVEVLKQHDDSVANLNAEGTTLFKQMIQSSLLRDTFAITSTSEALGKLKDENPDLFADPDPAKILEQIVGRRPEETLLAWLAELSINRRSLEGSWRIAPFWNLNKQSFVEVVPHCPAYARVLRARELTLVAIREGITMLKITRKELSKRHGVPGEGALRSFDNTYSSFGPPFRF